MASEDLSVTRRTVIEATGVTLTGTVLAGCSTSGQLQNGGDTGPPTESSGDSSGAKSFGGWMEDVGNYNRVVGKAEKNEVAVKVGTQGNGGAYAFAPAAIRIASGTTVVWEWTGRGNTHNVVDNAGNFESDMLIEKGATFEHTFESSGTYEYYCEPHKAMGMKGIVVVE